MLRLLAFLALILVPVAPLRAAADVSVFAAASLKNALEEIAAEWTRTTGEDVTLTFAASSTIARQVDQGAPADIILLANDAWMRWLESRGRLRPGSQRVLTGNRLVLVAAEPVELIPAPEFDLATALDDGHLAMGLVDAVPVGIYGKAALTALGVWDKVAPRVAQTDNARSALALVSAGEAPFGIVYASDAWADPRVHVAGVFPEESHSPIRYPSALNGESGEGAEAFFDYLHGNTVRHVWVAHGFPPHG